eukprot:jgi/Bigna1/76518/fgenesh1_pg.41_\
MLLFFGILLSGFPAHAGNEPNPPSFPDTVKIFSPKTDPAKIQSAINDAFAKNGGHNPSNNGQFSSLRYAFMFLPGNYTTDVPVGFYTQILGLGENPDDVVFSSENGVYSPEGDYGLAGALCSFWRSAENFASNAYAAWTTGTGMLWAVSQAAPLRRVHVKNTLVLYQYEPPIPQAGYSSGGYFADMLVDGAVTSGSQQQWFARSSKIQQWKGGVWNMVFAGVDGAPAPHCGNKDSSPYVVLDDLNMIAGKPFITAKPDGSKFYLNVPPVLKGQTGPSFDAPNRVVDFSNVYVTTPSDTAATMNAKLAEGLDLVISPGIYKIDEPIEVMKDDQVVLCLGMATLKSVDGNAVIRVGNKDGVRIGGCLLEAGPKNTSALLQWGDGTYAGKGENPGIIQDVFARVGGPDTEEVFADVMINIQSGHVIGDNLWLWRADHTVAGEVTNSTNKCTSGLVVGGDDVTMLGLAVEHTLGDLVSWTGERGETVFFQSELPYDVTEENYGSKGYAGYRVDDAVKEHTAYGLGVYTNFVADNVTISAGVQVPEDLVSSAHSSVAVYLSGRGIMNHIVRDQGDSTGWNTQNLRSNR